MELLAPAGSYEALAAAVQSGADAVYVGGSRFSARGTAHNFTDEELLKWVKYCHLYGVSVHVAANTLIKESETRDFLEYIDFLNSIGVDAVIMQDLGMANIVHKKYPDLCLHASTQITCASQKTAKELEKIGFSRIVLARELDEKSIESIKKSVNAEIEIFVHGAICMCYSGQCLMSSMIGGRSGNRGFCAQPCRLSYNFIQNGKNISGGYLLSPKDMSLASHIKTLNKIGVDSLKIEGRLKRSEYVSAVVGVYRKLIDDERMPTPDEKQELLDAFNRSGFTDGYFVNKKGSNMMAYETPSNIANNKFTKEATSRCNVEAIFKKIPVTINAELRMGRPLFLQMSDGENTVKVSGNVACEYANNTPLDYKRLIKQLEKLGNTPFTAQDVQARIDDGITLAISEINEVRRNAVLQLSEIREKVKPSEVLDITCEIKNKPVTKMSLTASVMTLEQAKICINKGIKRIYASREIIKKLNDENAELVVKMPEIDREFKNSDTAEKAVMISSIGQKNENDDIYLNSRINITNSYTLDLFKDCKIATLSCELTLKEIKEMKKPISTEVIVYGHIPLMVFENCPIKAQNKCDNGKSQNYFKDRMNESFPLVCTPGCFCQMLNSKPVYMADKLEDIKDTGVEFLRLDFTVEDASECEKVIDEYKDALYNGIYKKRKDNTFTRGHFYNPVK